MHLAMRRLLFFVVALSLAGALPGVQVRDARRKVLVLGKNWEVSSQRSTVSRRPINRSLESSVSRSEFRVGVGGDYRSSKAPSFAPGRRKRKNDERTKTRDVCVSIASKWFRKWRARQLAGFLSVFLSRSFFSKRPKHPANFTRACLRRGLFLFLSCLPTVQTPRPFFRESSTKEN